MSKEIRNSIFNLSEGSISGGGYWTPQTLVVEDAAPTNVVMTSTSANTNLVASDFTIAGFTVSSLSRDGTNKILTLTLDIPVYYGDVLIVVYKGVSYSVTNNVAISEEYTTVYNAMIAKPTGNDIVYQNKWLASLVNNGTYAKAIVLDNTACPTEQASLLNWKSPGTYNPSKVGANIVHTVYKGFTCNGSTNNIGTNFIASTNGAGFLGQNDITVIAAVNTEVAESKPDFTNNDAHSIQLNSHYPGYIGYVSINGATTQGIISTASKRYWSLSRNAGATFNLYKNNAKDIFTLASTGLGGSQIYTSGGTKITSMFMVFKFLTDSEIWGVIKSCEDYLTNYGNNIKTFSKTVDFNLVLEGHSFLTWSAPTIESVNKNVNCTTYYNSAVGGSIIEYCTNRAATVDGKLITETATYKNILALYIGVNEVDNTAGTGTNAFNNLKVYVQARITAGWKVFVFTMTPSTASARGAQFEIERDTFNGLLRSDLALISGVYIMDTDTIAQLDNPANATYYSDTLHPTTTAGILIGSLFSDKIFELYG